jgi:uncharacterized membrane protein YkvA (DUF1232 family)
MRGNRRSPAFWLQLMRPLRVAWRLLLDRRVPFLPKLLPLLTFLYIISPLDFVPDVILGLGQLDDLSLFLFSVYAFIAICPRDIVEHIRRDLDGDVIDGEAYTHPNDPTPPAPRLPKSGK